jgi:hypothetical protein
MQVKDLDRRAHADAPRERRRLAHQKLRHRQRVDAVDIDRLAVVLADEGVAEAEFVGEDDLAQILVVGLGSRRVRAKAIRENTEFRGPVLPLQPPCAS